MPPHPGLPKSGTSIRANKKGAITRASLLKPFNESYYFCGRLAGGMILFIRKYSTIWP